MNSKMNLFFSILVAAIFGQAIFADATFNNTSDISVRFKVVTKTEDSKNGFVSTFDVMPQSKVKDESIWEYVAVNDHAFITVEANGITCTGHTVANKNLIINFDGTNCKVRRIRR